MDRTVEGEGSLALDGGQRSIGCEANDCAIVYVADAVAADGLAHEGVAIVVGRPDAQLNAWKTPDWLDDPHELRWPEYPPETQEPWRKIGDSNRASLLIGQRRRNNGRVTQVMRFEYSDIVEDDVHESFFFIAREQSTENRIAGKSRETPPYQPCRRID